MGDTEQLSASRGVWATAEELIASIHPAAAASLLVQALHVFVLLSLFHSWPATVYTTTLCISPAGLCESWLTSGLSQRKVPGGGPRERKTFLPPLCSGSFLSSSCMSFMNPVLDRLSFCGSRFYLLASGHHFLLVPPVAVHTGFLLLILGLFMIICWDLCWEPLYPLSK